MELFIEYANTDLRKSPEFLLRIVGYLDWQYCKTWEQAGYKMSLDQNPAIHCDAVSFSVPVGCGSPIIKSIFQKLISDYTALKGQIGERSPTAVLYHAANTKHLHKGDLGAAIKICACEGMFYWAMGNQGCASCKYNMIGERDFFNKTAQNACFVCDWLAFREMLSEWAAENGVLPGHYDLLESFNQINHKESIIRKNGSLEDCEFLTLYEDMGWLTAPQRFSQITMAVLWHDINRFLSQPRAKKNSPDPSRLIKQCRICKKFFIASRSNATNCSDCIGVETREAWRERQASRRARSEQEVLKVLREMGRKRGKSIAEINEILDYFLRDGYKAKEILMLPETDIFPPEV